MLDFQFIQAIASAVGIALGSTYVIGGLIVNLHLARYGVTEYQILRIKYLVVGLVYLTNAVAIYALATIPAIFFMATNYLSYQSLLMASLLASLWLLWLWGKPVIHRSRKELRSWHFWVAVSIVASIFPLMIAIRQVVFRQFDLYSAIVSVEALLAGVLIIIAQIYYYARHLYGRRTSVFGSHDPVGMGTPVTVQLAGDKNDLSLLQSMEIPLLKPDLTTKVLLLDETDAHYIVGIMRETGIQALKVSKDIVRAILYLQ